MNRPGPAERLLIACAIKRNDTGGNHRRHAAALLMPACKAPHRHRSLYIATSGMAHDNVMRHAGVSDYL